MKSEFGVFSVYMKAFHYAVVWVCVEVHSGKSLLHVAPLSVPSLLEWTGDLSRVSLARSVNLADCLMGCLSIYPR